MGADHSFYRGGDYGFEPGPENSPLGFNYGNRIEAGSIGIAVDSRTANQLKAVSDKLSSGTKVIEVQGVDANMIDAIPQQQFKEIARLKKLVGAEVTFHGPLVEPTGIGREGWDEGKRESAERQLLSAVRRGHDLDEKGNLVITFHSSTLPEMENKVMTTENGKKVQKVTDFYVIDEKTHNIQKKEINPNYLLNEKGDPKLELDRMNKENWTRLLSHTAFNVHHVERAVDAASSLAKQSGELFGAEKTTEGVFEMYKMLQTEEGRKKLEKDLKPEQINYIKNLSGEINFGEVYLRDSYNEIQNLFDNAWISAERNKNENDLQKLKDLRRELLPKIKSGAFLDPANMAESAELLSKGVQVMTSLDKSPQILRPLNEFALEKASETYGNVAYKAYKEFGNSAPIISIENPPAGGTGISRAEDLRDLVEASRDRFVKNAKRDGMSEDEAKREAEKLLGATWDVGHINMIRKAGYTKEDVIKETAKIAPFVKHVHLSDNFGMEHTELPMGMGNVPTKEMLDLITQYNSKVKKIVETGGPWYQFFQKTPLRETFEAFGSPVFQGQGSYWNTAAASTGSYFGGFGQNPDIHHSVYGAGFSSLPTELGGSIPGRGGSRLTGNPME